MEGLNNYKKIQIVLLVLIIIAFIVLIVSAVKTKRRENYIAETTFSETTDIVEEPIVIETNPDEEIIDEEDTSWDEEAEDTKVEDEENLEENDVPYYIKINYTANCVTIYKKDSSGKYTIPVKAIVCSTGKATPTSGVYKMSQKYRWHQLNGGVYGQYCSRITGHILFHSVPYSKQSPDSLKYVAYDKLGTKASAGCIRLTVQDALWIYNNCPSGTYVEFYSSSNPGPLGKPSAQKISEVEECRNWDPTDPIKENPWHTYTPKQEENNVQEENHEVIEEPPKEDDEPTENIPNTNNNDNISQENSTNPENNIENNPENEDNDDDKENEKSDNTTNENINETVDSKTEANEENNIIKETPVVNE